MKLDFSHTNIKDEELTKIKDILNHALKWLWNLSERKVIGFLELPFRDTEHIKRLVADKRKELDTLILIGIGGSSLGAECLIKALKGSYEKFFVLDNVDPIKLKEILPRIDPEKCCFNVVSKSGSTAETIANFIALVSALKEKLGWEKIKERLVITTDPEKGSLRELARKENIASLEVPPNVAGRYSVLSDVGLFPAAFTGIDIDKVLLGAKTAYKELDLDVLESKPLILSGIYWLSYLKGKRISVMMTYSERLEKFSDWYRQLWAESLGKGEKGQPPVKAIGTVDQHSQIQLYNDGPKDKIITLLHAEELEGDFCLEEIPAFSELESFKYLFGHSLGELFKAELLGTMGAFIKYRVPFLRLTLDRINEENMGWLFFTYQVATAINGYLYGVNPFDQPAVEEGKRFAYGILGRQGFEEKRKELTKLLQFDFLESPS